MKPLQPISHRSRQVDALVVGENSLDLIATVGEYPAANSKHELVGFDELPGGEAATAAVGLARLGWRTKYIGRFGDDSWGRGGRDDLRTEGVDVADVVMVPGATSRFAVILVDRSAASRTVLWRRAPALALTPGDVTDAALSATRVVLVGSDDVDAMTSVAKRARARDVRTVGDIERIGAGTDALLRELDVIVMAASFPPAFTGQSQMGTALRAVAEHSGAALACVTLGDEGCLAVAGGEEIRIPALATDVVDTTGAGDLFRAGLIARWLQQDETTVEVEDVLRYATATAALNCRSRGARAGAPRAADVAALLASWG